MKVLFASSEAVPFMKTGGLGDVAGTLPRAVARQGLDARLAMPLYAGIPRRPLECLDGALHVPMSAGEARAAVWMGNLPGAGVPVYFIEHQHYFGRPHAYGPPGGEYGDNLERFTFFSRAVLALCRALGFSPDVVHSHDWQTALLPVLLDEPSAADLGRPASVHTIHNLAYQGVFDGGAFAVTGLPPERFAASDLEHFGAVNLLKGAIRRSTLLTTVSPTYAEEIRHGEQGCGLDGVLRDRGDALRGVLNGVDVEEWSPATDGRLPARYDATDLTGKALCKRQLQIEMGLSERRVPLFGVVSRLTHQKGLDVLAAALDRILDWHLQIVLLGSGDPEAEDAFRAISAARGDKLGVTIGFDVALAHRIEAASDFFLMPSRFEPCGLSQMVSLLYGTLPIVRSTGGLVDTVQQYDEATGDGTGFRFDDLSPDALADTVGWAVSTYYDRPAHIEAMRRRGMALDFSWDRGRGALRRDLPRSRLQAARRQLHVGLPRVFPHHPRRRERGADAGNRAFHHADPSRRQVALVTLVVGGHDLLLEQAVERQRVLLILRPLVGGLDFATHRKTVRAVVALGPPAVENAAVHDAVDAGLLTARAAGLHRPARRVEPDVAALHHAPGDVHVVVLDEEEPPAQPLLLGQLEDVLNQPPAPGDRQGEPCRRGRPARDGRDSRAASAAGAGR